jgi:hypothetical protein
MKAGHAPAAHEFPPHQRLDSVLPAPAAAPLPASRSFSTLAVKMRTVPELCPARKQSRAMSFVEAVTNVIVGFLLALVTQIALFPMFGLVVSLVDNVVIGGIFTAVSILRSFMLRRVFEAIRVREH